MEWSRIKTIMLIILVVTNVSLLGFLVQRELQAQNAQQEPKSGRSHRQPEETPGASLGRLRLGKGLGRFKTVQSTFPSLLLNLCKGSEKKYSTDFVEGKEIL